ncbi:MAG: hypothetical protein A2W91_02455 [Bacteroidetes bacterium GWF2_38_335]|nr:MAG: hypothetical protein A2W91_02455 [Bacteroidetes bacterium GWF2_38_335]OFY80709.1 MAG: hypothetical protein A2281_05470 [Bacteroidetes bacterium RIFOXYA12_FULL_38_20]HBS87057.1 hypothetical protein [Bacteroidales bacterium]
MKKTIYVIMAVLFMAAFVACDSKKEEKKDDGADKDKELKADVQKITDIMCEMEGLTTQMQSIKEKYDTSATLLLEINVLVDLMKGCALVTPEEIDAFKANATQAYLTKKGTGLVIEEKKDKKGVLEAYLIKDEKKKVVETVKVDSISAETQGELQNYVNMLCQQKEMMEELNKVSSELDAKYKDDKEIKEKSKKAYFEQMEKCPNISPEKLEEMKKSM